MSPLPLDSEDPKPVDTHWLNIGRHLTFKARIGLGSVTAANSTAAAAPASGRQRCAILR